MKKINIFPLLVRDGLAHVSLYRVPPHARWAGLFDLLKGKDAKLKFFSHIGWDTEGVDISFCIEEGAYGRIEGELKKMARALGAGEVVVKKPVAVIRVLGPHFDIRPRMSALIYGALLEEGLEVIANSTTITTSLLVVPQDSIQSALRALRKHFRDTVKRR